MSRRSLFHMDQNLVVCMGSATNRVSEDLRDLALAF